MSKQTTGKNSGKSQDVADTSEQALTTTESRSDRLWQRRLLPFMVGMLAALTVFFCIASLIQLNHLNSRIEEAPVFERKSVDSAMKGIQGGSVNDPLDMIRWHTLTDLEAHALQLRYHQANILLMSRIWTRYVGFLTGMILALVGATFILGKLREAGTRLDAESDIWKFSLATASPGIVLAVLGTLLMLTTLVAQQDIEVEDRALFTPSWNAVVQPAAAPPPVAFPSDSAIRAEMRTETARSGGR